MAELINKKALDSFNDSSRNIVGLALYPEIPPDMDDGWAKYVTSWKDDKAKENFLNSIGTGQYEVELAIDADTGDFEVVRIEFFNHSINKT